MNEAKNDMNSVFKWRGPILKGGLIIAMSIALYSFSIDIPKDAPKVKSEVDEMEAITFMPITTQQEKVVEIPPEAPKPEPIQLTTEIDIVEEKEPLLTFDSIEFVDPFDTEIPPMHLTEIIKEEVPTVAFRTIQDKPEPIGGEDQFYKFLRKEVKYPPLLRDSDVQGKVYVTFVIDTEGAVGDFEILRSPHELLSQETIRVLSMTKWKPGAQRGRKVKVRMQMPMEFRIN